MEPGDEPARAAEIKPPWVAYPDVPPHDFFWRESGEPWLNLVWRPFWKALDAPAQEHYLERFPPPPDWRTSFLDDRLDQLLAEIDAEAESAEPLPAANRAGSHGGLWRSILRRLTGKQ